MENEQETIIDSEQTNEEVQEETVEETVEETKVEKPVETPEAKRARLKRQLEQLDKKLGIKEEKKEEKNEEGLSRKDIIYLAKADINEADVDEVVNYAEKMGVSVKDAHEHFKPILKIRQEERATAQATQTKSPRSSKVTSESILEKARQGQAPESDEDIEKLVEAEMNAKLAKK